MKISTLIIGSCIVVGAISWYLSKTINEGETLSLLANNHATEGRIYAHIQDLISHKDYDGAIEILSAMADGAKIAVDQETKSIEDNIITRYLYGSYIENPKQYLEYEHNQ